ncbi:MAG: hypothetical protein JXR25_03075 [Pontiellaceae bacterium]|nr:hypothetical protein [Pontiellaceae bacterium]
MLILNELFSGVIVLLNGEGNYGNTEIYKGKKTIRALKLKVTKERSGGDRWCRVFIEDRGFIDKLTGHISFSEYDLDRMEFTGDRRSFDIKK